MRPATLLLLPSAMLLAASAPARNLPDPVGAALRSARSETQAAFAEQQRLEAAAEQARGEADRLRAERAAAAQAIVAAEAAISAADAEHRLVRARLASLNGALEQQQRPLSALVGGLVTMGRRPPLLALADSSSTDELVRVQLLLVSTLPAIRRRAAALSAQLGRAEALERRLAATRAGQVRTRAALQARQQAFALLESRAVRQAAAYGAGALAVGDVVLAAGEEAERLTGEAEAMRAGAAVARELAPLGPAVPRPTAPEPLARGLRYVLPAAAPVVRGFGSVSASGIRARGITLATRRGSAIAAPADGIVRFAGPFREYDGIVIIDHGGGWKSLIVNVGSEARPGARVKLGQALGRALGPIEVELALGGRRVSPALIAGSSRTLSNGGKIG